MDGCFLKGKFGGVCLSVVSLDKNNGQFPLAIYVCKAENAKNWKAFMETMRPLLDIHPLPLTMISDRQKGLVQSIREVFPNYNQRFYFRHMYRNMKYKHRGLEKLIWGAARKFMKDDHERLIKELEKQNVRAKQYLMLEEPSLWARSHYDTISKCDHNTSNFVEAFNSFILEARDKPIVKMVAHVQSLMMKLMFERKQLSNGLDADDVVNRVHGIIDKRLEKRGNYSIQGAKDDTWEVTHHMGKWFIVDLDKKMCTCMKWQI